MKKLFLLILFVQFISVTFAQMSDDQVVAMVKEAQNQGKTQQQIIMMLGQKGVTQEQLIRITIPVKKVRPENKRGTE